jgi:hypothetical protein
MYFLTAVLGIVVLWIVSNAYSLLSNYLIARRCGLPVRVTPINPDNLLWLIPHEFYRPYLEAILPTSLLNIIKPNFYGWEFQDRYRFHHRVGSTFLLVTPGDIECWVANPPVAQVILTRRKDFVASPVTAKIVGFCGPNLLTVSQTNGYVTPWPPLQRHLWI